MTADARKREPWKVTEARGRRVQHLADAVLEWQRLAAQNQYPQSLVEILKEALEREYRLGKKLRA